MTVPVRTSEDRLASGISAEVGAIVLAAGRGERFGGPKGLARLGGESWLALAVSRLQESGIRRVTVVLGAEADRVRREADLPGAAAEAVSWVYNLDYPRGRTGSIQCGLRDQPDRVRGALLHQVDFPFVAPETFRLLAGAFDREPEADGLIFVSVQGGRRGHPILIGRARWPEILALGPDEPLRALVGRDPERVREIDVDDPGIHRNINSEEDVSSGSSPAG
jgi:CTP:molybdopterin cytidylyltransferase MocA